MSGDGKQIVGVNLGIDPDYLEGVVKDVVSASILEAMTGKEEVARQLVSHVLDEKVDPSSGKASRYSDAVPRLRYLMTQAVEGAVREALRESVEAAKPQLREMIVQKLQTGAVLDSMCEAMLSSMTEALGRDYRTTINFEFVKKDKF